MSLSAQRVALRSTQKTAVRNMRASRLVVRASEEPAAPKEEPAETVVFYTTKSGEKISGTEAEYNASVAGKDTYRASSITGVKPAVETTEASTVEQVPLGDVMAFAGPGPEIINGRLAMLAFASAAAAELSTGKPVLEQLSCEPTLIALTAVLFSAGSLVTLVKNVEVLNLGVFSADKEMFNGRAAMLGFASLLVVEQITGSAFF